MPIVPIRQPSFAAGEINSLLWGRTDWAKYTSALRTMKNWFATPYGPAMNRPGTRYSAIVDSSGVVKNFRSTPFKLSNDIGHILVWSNAKIAVYSQAGVNLANIVVPYLDAELDTIQWAQFGNIIFIVQGNHPPAILLRTNDVTWTYTVMDFSTAQFLQVLPPTIIIALADGATPAVMPTWNNATAYPAGTYVFNPGDGKSYMSLNPVAVAEPAPNANTKWVVAVDSSHPAVAKVWTGTILWLDIFGFIHESKPVWTWSYTGSVYTDRPVTLKLAAFPIPSLVTPPPNFSKIIGFRYYKGNAGIQGFISETDSTVTQYQDRGDVPDFSSNPPTGTDPSVYFDAAGNPQVSYPTAVSIFEERLVLGGPGVAPQRINLSEIADFYNFNESILPRDDAAFETSLFSDTLNDIRSFVPYGALLAFCGSSEWSVKGSADGPLTSTDVNPKRQSGYGSSFLHPLTVGDRILFNTVLGTGVRDVEYSFQSNSFSGRDLSVYASHLFENLSIKGWTYADKPYKLVWSVRSDGNLVGITYSKEEEVVAFHQHNSPGAFFLDVCSLPSGTEHGVFFLVRRNGIVYLEKLASRIILDLRHACFLDCSFEFQGYVTDGTQIQIGAGDYVAGDDVPISRVGVAGSHPFAVTDIGSQVVFFPDEVTPFRFTITQFTDTDHVSGTAEQDSSYAAHVGLNGTVTWAWARSSFQIPITTLEGFELGVLGDGSDLGTAVVTGQVIQISNPSVIVQVGFSYLSDLEMLSVVDPAQESSSTQKTVTRIVVEVDKTVGLMFGPSLTKLKEWQPRRRTDGTMVPMCTAKLSLTGKTGWDPDGRISFRQAAPLPATIVAVTREVKYGG